MNTKRKMTTFQKHYACNYFAIYFVMSFHRWLFITWIVRNMYDIQATINSSVLTWNETGCNFKKNLTNFVHLHKIYSKWIFMNPSIGIVLMLRKSEKVRTPIETRGSLNDHTIPSTNTKAIRQPWHPTQRWWAHFDFWFWITFASRKAFQAENSH